MSSVSNDEQLVSHIREATAAQSTSQFPRSLIAEEIEGAKTRLNREVASIASNDQFDLYHGTDAAMEALVVYMELRIEEVVRQRDSNQSRAETPIPKSIGKLRTHNFDDVTLQYRRDQLLKHLNTLST